MTAATNVTLESLGFNLAPTEPTKEWAKQKIVMAGPPKCGKTKFWASAGEKAWFLRLESGFNHVKTSGVDCVDYNEIEKAIDRLFKAKVAGIFPWETLVIDPASRLLDFMSEETITRGRQKFPNSEIYDIGDIGKGTGWYIYKCLIKDFLKRLEGIPCAVVLVFHIHTEERNEEGSTKNKYKRDIVSVSEKIGGPIREWADHILHIRHAYVGDIECRKMVTQGSKTVEAGSRMKLPAEMRWDADDLKNYTEFRKLFT